MSKPPFTPGETAIVDQAMDDVGAELDKLVRDVQFGDAEVGNAQNTANFIAFLHSKHDPSYLAALVVVAARRIGGAS
jgi:hypothetical protein